MKKYFYYLLCTLFIFFQLPVFGANHKTPVNLEDHPVMQAPVQLDRAQLEAQLGRKLTLKERIGFSLVKSGIARDRKHHPVAEPAPTGGVNGFGVAGFVIGLVSLFVAGIPLGILAIVFSAVAIGQIDKKGEKGKGFAIAGLILGLVGLVGALIVLGTM